MLSPRQIFEDILRPAELLLRVYSLLENERVHTDGELIQKLHQTIQAFKDLQSEPDESLMLIYNEVFIGLIRERAQFSPGVFKKAALGNLLRQCVVAACTAMEAFLPVLLRSHLPIVIQAKGRDFFPSDKEVQSYFQGLTFDIGETLRLIGDPSAPLYIANKIVSYSTFKYLSGKKGIHTVGSLLTIKDPWQQIADHLSRKREDMEKLVEDAARRRNDIVHRADRVEKDNTDQQQDMSYAWAMQAVDTIRLTCFTLNTLVEDKMKELKAEIEAHTVRSESQVPV